MLAALALTLVLAACERTSAPERTVARSADSTSAAFTSPPTTTFAPSPETTTTMAPPVAEPAPPPPPEPPQPDPDVVALQSRLADLAYDVGAVDGQLGPATAQALTAFQKVEGLPRTGEADATTLTRLAGAGRPAPLMPGGGPTRVEVDVDRQVLFLYTGGNLDRILPVSTGSGQRYCVNGRCDIALTPGGSYRIGRRVSGWDSGPLGDLYNPLYFNGGIAIHGALSVPSWPASHGCVRIPMSAAEWFPAKVATGTPVYVKGGPAG